MFEGLSVAMVTPFRDGRLDEDATKRLVEFLVTSAVDCLVVAGTTGEGVELLTSIGSAGGQSFDKSSRGDACRDAFWRRQFPKSPRPPQRSPFHLLSRATLPTYSWPVL